VVLNCGCNYAVNHSTAKKNIVNSSTVAVVLPLQILQKLLFVVVIAAADCNLELCDFKYIKSSLALRLLYFLHVVYPF
jgi:hypothetical protein